MFRTSLVAIIILCAATHCLAAERPRAKPRSDRSLSSGQTPAANIKVDVPFVLIPVHVATDIGRPVMELESKDFRLFDDNIEHSIKSFAKDDAPISVGMVFDSSGSMKSKMTKSVEAASAFLKTASPADEHFLVEFGDRAKLSIPFTDANSDPIAKIARIRPFGRTSLFDAIHLSLKQMGHARNKRRAIVIFSDGGDNCSRRTMQEIRNSLLEANVQLYAIGIIEEDSKDKPTREEIAGPGVLDELTQITGGLHFRSGLSDLTPIAERVGNELRSQYLIGYTPITEEGDGKYHRVRVTISKKDRMPGLRVSHRLGYYSSN